MTNSYENLISLLQASQEYSLSSDHLRLLAEKGKIWAIKIGRNWVTSKASVEEYKNQRHPRGPKSKKVEKS